MKRKTYISEYPGGTRLDVWDVYPDGTAFLVETIKYPHSDDEEKDTP